MSEPNRSVKVLILEDVPEDAELMIHELEMDGFNLDSRIVDDQIAFESDLEHFKPDIILSDFSLPKTSGLEALLIAKTKAPDVPFIFITGTIGEEIAAETILNGASGLLLKQNLKKLPKMVNELIQSRSLTSHRLKGVLDRIDHRIKENVEALSRINTFINGSKKTQELSENIKSTIEELKNIQSNLKD